VGGAGWSPWLERRGAQSPWDGAREAGSENDEDTGERPERVAGAPELERVGGREREARASGGWSTYGGAQEAGSECDAGAG